jgi:hypothetical protein
MNVIRLLFRTAGMIALSIAVILATGDAMRSGASSALVLTPLGESWDFGSPATLAALRAHLGGGPAGNMLAGLLSLPAGIVFAAAAALLLLIGRRKRPAQAAVARGR